MELDNAVELLDKYEVFITNKDLLGIFDYEIFKKWKQFLSRKDDIRKE
jgi:hypothetical protein